MTAGVAVMGVMVLILSYIAYKKGIKILIESYVNGFKGLWNSVPLLILAFILAGLIEVLIPPEMIHKWLGEGSGLTGILIATAAGGLLPSGPYISFPLIATFYDAGASLSVVISFVVSWSLLGSIKLPFELALLGPKFTIFRYIVMIPFPIVAGLLVYLFF